MNKMARIFIAAALVLAGAYAVARECAGGTRIYKIITNGVGVEYVLCNEPGQCDNITAARAEKLKCAY